MKKLLKKLEYLFDIYIAWMFYNGRKQHLYYEYINKKYNFMAEHHVPLTISEDGLVTAVGNANDIYEDCIMCGCKTETLKTTHIDFRYGYVEGAGQLCRSCYLGEDRNLITINSRTILDTPNDSELGAKVRQMYWDSKK